MDEYYAYYNSPIGVIHIKANERTLLSVMFLDNFQNTDLLLNFENDIVKQTMTQFTEYFASQRKEFNLPVDFSLGTDFQQRVWSAVNSIAYGKTLSYLKLAQQLGSEKLVRAVGTANGRNPLLLIIPCHRVIGANGKLVGYAGALWRKQWLLEHESNDNRLVF